MKVQLAPDEVCDANISSGTNSVAVQLIVLTFNVCIVHICMVIVLKAENIYQFMGTLLYSNDTNLEEYRLSTGKIEVFCFQVGSGGTGSALSLSGISLR